MLIEEAKTIQDALELGESGYNSQLHVACSNSHFDVTQASRLRVPGASSPRGASKGETPPELAAETAALRRQVA